MRRINPPSPMYIPTFLPGGIDGVDTCVIDLSKAAADH